MHTMDIVDRGLLQLSNRNAKLYSTHFLLLLHSQHLIAYFHSSLLSMCVCIPNLPLWLPQFELVSSYALLTVSSPHTSHSHYISSSTSRPTLHPISLFYAQLTKICILSLHPSNFTAINNLIENYFPKSIGRSLADPFNINIWLLICRRWPITGRQRIRRLWFESSKIEATSVYDAQCNGCR